MGTSIKPVLENLNGALDRLEQAIEKRLDIEIISQVEMDLGEGEQLDTMIASKLDNTIERLETILNEE